MVQVDSIRRREQRRANPEKALAASRRWESQRRVRTSEEILRRKLRTQYGITLEQYREMVELQGGVCKLCGKPPANKTPQTSRLAVDHCHETGRIRGLLCYRCNSAVAALGDNMEGALRLVEYMTA